MSLVEFLAEAWTWTQILGASALIIGGPIWLFGDLGDMW